jgi:hypothetical protein
MTRKNKIDRAKVMAALNTICPSCRYAITPAEISRVSFTGMKYPKCGSVFEAGKTISKAEGPKP